ncbi:lipocalin/fatty acid-binding family protein [Streptomyces justiciae]|uniref:calcium-binding protein n=1 Tax=Streptomyces justiciae TaxID=2780140 RepID=UPI00187DFDF9|nr:calcium-binding protein [Streptomyces justiciae]MBE8477127.1 calcium-binding protein [Streptomyces justiciae]
MRMRATLGVVTGALALSALAVPAAQADEVHGDTAISNVVVNGGKPVVISATGTKTFNVTFTVTDNSGVDYAEAILYHGADIDSSDAGALANSSDGRATCTAVSATKSNCKASYTLDAGYDVFNKHAGTWRTWAIATGDDADYVIKENAKSFFVQRLSKLTVNASPEPVRKGKTITVTGKLTRANWDAEKYSGYSGQSVKLQFRKKGASTYTTVKTIKSTSTGGLSTTVTASADGYYRYSFAGTSTTPAVNATGDYIDVQ